MNPIKRSHKFVRIVFVPLMVMLLSLSAYVVAPSTAFAASILPPLSNPSIDIQQKIQALMQQLNAPAGSPVQAKIQETQMLNAQIQQITEQINACRALNGGKAPTPEMQALYAQLNQLISQAQSDILQLHSMIDQLMMNKHDQSYAMISALLNQQAELLASIVHQLQ